MAKYLDSIIQSRTSALTSLPKPQSPARLDGASNPAESIIHDARCQMYIALAMKHYGAALKLSTKHVYQALPRLLSLCFELMAIQTPSPEKAVETAVTSTEKTQVSYGSRRRSSSGGKTKVDGKVPAYLFVLLCADLPFQLLGMFLPPVLCFFFETWQP